ncbi:MAG TPA: two-component regulator propeller domain-containing protein, partial [Thermoanaerobaculia bacterium]|nr:two-component regulator propeller domain-containing protein [Thermoanaerobaculia bacterium]
MVRVLAILLISLGALADGRPGLVSFRRVPIPDEVPAHLCSAIAQDARGFLWFGTQGGLVRYDGAEWRVFKANPNDPKTLAGNYVRALLAARDGRLWVGTFSGGLSVFDPKTETFTRFRVAYDRVEGLAEDASGRIWIATTAGLDRLDPRTQQIEHFRHDANDAASIADDRVRGLLIDSRGALWVGTREGLQRWLGEGRGFARVAPELAGQYVIRLYEDRRGDVWIGTEDHGAAVLRVDGTLHRIAPRPADPDGLSHYWVYGFAEGPNDEMWIATFGGGVDVADTRTLRIIDRLKTDASLPDTIGADRVGAVFRDRTGLMWVGTWGEGIARHDPRTRAFRSLRFSPDRPDGLTHAAAVRAMEMHDGTIWVGTNGNGIDVFDRELRRVGGHRPGANGLTDGAITCLGQSSDGTIWVATLNSMLHRLRPGATRFEVVPAERLPGGPIRAMAFDDEGTLWIGAAEGMARIDPNALTSRVYKRWPGAGKSSPAIESIVLANGTVWAGSDNGLYAFDPRTESAKRFAKPQLPENWVPDLMLARDGRLWIGTAGGAVTFDHFERHTAAPAEALIEDADGNVWIGPRLRISAKNVRELGPADGVAFRNFFIASRSRMRDGRLLFGSPEGLLVVDPRRIPPRRSDAPIAVAALQIDGKARPALDSLTLSSRERSFALDVAPLDFAAPRAPIRYRLEGLDDEWGSTQRSIHYSRLPPGHYTLHVMNGTRELRLPVTVEPAWYQTWLFRAFAAIVALALLYGAYRLRVRRLRARERELEKLVAARTQQLETAYAQIEEASLTDPLTGLRNRRFLEQSIAADLDLSARGHGDLVVLLIDLDHFKNVNDTHGHAAGDAVLA